MGGVNVKNTMIEWVLEKVAPHPCSGCLKIGTILCEDCKNDIEFETFDGCMQCGRPEKIGICQSHRSPLERVYIVGQYHGTLKKLISNLKFRNVKATAVPLAALLARRLPALPDNVILVPIPTLSSHVRQRGFDQVDLIVKQLSYERNVPVVSLLRRATSTTQHTESRAKRKEQAKIAFALRPGTRIDTHTTYLLVDDVITTGSTMLAAAIIIAELGGTVWAAGLAYQPLD